MEVTCRLLLLLLCLVASITDAKQHHHRQHNRRSHLQNEREKLNVLFLISDDLRAEVKPFHDQDQRPWLYDGIKTPNLERLASKSFVFKKAYTQAPRCNPSRTSFLTGRRPDTTKVFNNGVFFRDSSEGHLVTLPEFFKHKGYHTRSIGKVFHAESSLYNDAEFSWSDGFEAYSADGVNDKHDHSFYVVSEKEATDHPFGDLNSKNYAVKQLQEYNKHYKNHGQHFFLAVGLKKPHLPFTVPDKHVNQYSLDDIGLAKNPHPANGTNIIAWPAAGEFVHYKDIEHYFKVNEYHMNSSMPDDVAKHLRKAYYGCVSFVDDLFGEIMKEMDDLNLWEDTVVVFMSDHGYHLGEGGVWGKNTIWEESLHVPLMVRIPGKSTAESEKLVELVDVYPTLVEAAGFGSIPVCPENGSDKKKLCTEGSSLMPLIEEKNATWKDSVFSQSVYPLYEGEIKYSGHTVRTGKHRYTEWVPFDGSLPHRWNELVFSELFDLENDPYQMSNKVNASEYKDVVEDMKQKLHSGWRASHPSL
ncbi:hypothetical protein CAPTEDRAFT_171028 [Capitella teleta]|uniref:Sulfatase N-terminal domain-containing protein n=1 Tax=Capitella teleta TaxID=283909 RepID=R7UEE5_CAPTE|nr:hypothetical protein CAPTEDRAFT_171028 [Capitella teleta]|eukprot:ELU04349.1 hypothetical protein CAPTEDRAFT_171028 [Capitella teleta]